MERKESDATALIHSADLLVIQQMIGLVLGGVLWVDRITFDRHNWSFDTKQS